MSGPRCPITVHAGTNQTKPSQNPALVAEPLVHSFCGRHGRGAAADPARSQTCIVPGVWRPLTSPGLASLSRHTQAADQAARSRIVDSPVTGRLRRLERVCDREDNKVHGQGARAQSLSFG
jgi:hypothetical protein